METVDLFENIPDMTNEGYREELRKLFEKIDDNTLLKFFYAWCDKTEKDWNNWH